MKPTGDGVLDGAARRQLVVKKASRPLPAGAPAPSSMKIEAAADRRIEAAVARGGPCRKDADVCPHTQAGAVPAQEPLL
jgi:hypothetical protein